jgi:hypothetical protein
MVINVELMNFNKWFYNKIYLTIGM